MRPLLYRNAEYALHQAGMGITHRSKHGKLSHQVEMYTKYRLTNINELVTLSSETIT